MSYFEDLTPHTYTWTGDLRVLNVGWLDEAHPFPQGETPRELHEALRRLCDRPIWLHRGFHACPFCPREEWKKWPPRHPDRLGNGQIRVMDADGVWYAAPVMVHHYVTEHRYLPPAVFVATVSNPAAVGICEYV